VLQKLPDNEAMGFQDASTGTSSSNQQKSPRATNYEDITISKMEFKKGKEASRVNFCFFCDEKETHIARHFYRRHHDEMKVARAMSFPVKSAPRLALLDELRNLGNEKHNHQVILEKRGTLVPVRRSRVVHVTEDYLPCIYCHRLFLKTELLKHRARCHCVADADNSRLSRRYARATAQVSMFGPKSLTNDFRSNILERMINDEVHRTILQDRLILRFGQGMYNDSEGKRTGHQQCKNNMREAGRLLVAVKKLDSSVRSFDKLLNITYWNLLVAATIDVSHIGKDIDGCIPSLAIKLGYHINVLTNIVLTDSLLARTKTCTEEITSFIRLKELNWRASVINTARRKLQAKQTNKVKLLPLAEDLKIMTHYVKENINQCLEEFTNGEADGGTWLRLGRFLLVRLVMFNRKRVGELSSFEITEFHARTKGNLREDVAAGLTATERHFANIMSRCETVGKKNRNVPMLMTEDMVKALLILIDTRESIGGITDPTNQFVFANKYAYSTKHINGYDSFRAISKACGAKEYWLIRSTKLRQHIAVCSQILDLGQHELEQLATFMGHTLDVHRQYYRLPETTIQVSKISLLLQALDDNCIGKYAGKTLEEIEFSDFPLGEHMELEVGLGEDGNVVDGDFEDEEVAEVLLNSQENTVPYHEEHDGSSASTSGVVQHNATRGHTRPRSSPTARTVVEETDEEDAADKERDPDFLEETRTRKSVSKPGTLLNNQ
jgi:hypothetical protein